MTDEAQTSRRLSLGTAQFGLPYGLANKFKQVSAREAANILTNAWISGIDSIDTAAGYGDSEAVLGSIGVNSWRVVSKLPAVPASCPDVNDWFQRSVSAIMSRLRISGLYGLLLHQPSDLFGAHGAALYRALLSSRDHGLVTKIGVSIYDPKELDCLTDRFPVELVQAPYSVVDRRLVSSGWLKRLAESGTEIHARSAFLQGLLLMEPGSRPAYFERWRGLWQRWHDWLASTGIPPVQACLRFTLGQQEISKVVVGVNCVGQLKQLITAAGANCQVPPADLAMEDVALVHPSAWPKS